MKTYEFSYKDNEGDLYESDQFNSKQEAMDEIKALRKYYDGDFSVVESWVYLDETYVGTFY